MIGYTQWALRCKRHDCSKPIPVPPPIHTGRVADLGGWPKEERKAVFLCPGCGHVGLYSEADLQDWVLGTPDPYSEKLLDLVYIEAGCADRSCESRTKIHAVRDVAGKKLLGKVSIGEWVIPADLRCERDHQVTVDPQDSYVLYDAAMPF